MSENIRLEEIEADSLDRRLAEQEIFKESIKKKNKKFKRLLLYVAAGFMGIAGLWLFFHCLPLISKT